MQDETHSVLWTREADLSLRFGAPSGILNPSYREKEAIEKSNCNAENNWPIDLHTFPDFLAL